MDSLTYFLEQARWFDNMQLNTAAFESLKSSGFYLIRNDTLRIHIIELFDSSYKGKLAMINDSGLERYNAINNFYAISFSSEDTLGVVPNSMEDFMKDQQFYNIMSFRLNWKKFMSVMYRNLLKDTKRMQGEIQMELNGK